LHTQLAGFVTCSTFFFKNQAGQGRKRKIKYDEQRYKDRHLIENAFCRLKDFRRIATRYDKLARNFMSAVALATLVAYWL